MQNLKITLIQPNIIWENKKVNLTNYETYINNITSKPDVIILPEMFSTGFIMKPELVENMNGDTINWMKNITNNSNSYLMGSLIIKELDNIFNRFLCIKGELIEFYDKKHLFAYAGEDKCYTAGNQRKIININGWRILLQICYDLRFPVFSRNQDDYDVIVYVANWPAKRSLAWKTLLQARAIENQSYVIGVNRVGIDGNNLEYTGDSSLISPIGEIIWTSEEEEVIDLELDANLLQQVRNQLPFLKDRDNFEIK